MVSITLTQDEWDNHSDPAYDTYNVGYNQLSVNWTGYRVVVDVGGMTITYHRREKTGPRFVDTGESIVGEVSIGG